MSFLKHQLMMMAMKASGGAVTDSFATAGTLNNYTVSANGGTGTAVVSGNDLVLTPNASAINSVSVERNSLTVTSVAVTASLAPNPSGIPDYLDVSIGSGALVGTGGATNWWHTTLKNGYDFFYNGSGQFYLYKMVNGTSTSLGSYNNSAFQPTSSHTYELQISGGTVSAILDGTTIITATDSTYASGSALVAQGEYSNGNGAIASIPQIVYQTA